MKGLEISEYRGVDYKPAQDFGAWRVKLQKKTTRIRVVFLFCFIIPAAIVSCVHQEGGNAGDLQFVRRPHRSY